MTAKFYNPETLASCGRAYDLACRRLAVSGVLFSPDLLARRVLHCAEGTETNEQELVSRVVVDDAAPARAAMSVAASSTIH